AALERSGRFEWCREVLYHGRKALQYVAEAEVVLDRPAQQHRRPPGGPEGRQRIAGKALRLRLGGCQGPARGGRRLAQGLGLSWGYGTIGGGKRRNITSC